MNPADICTTLLLPTRVRANKPAFSLNKNELATLSAILNRYLIGNQYGQLMKNAQQTHKRKQFPMKFLHRYCGTIYCTKQAIQQYTYSLKEKKKKKKHHPMIWPSETNIQEVMQKHKSVKFLPPANLRLG